MENDALFESYRAAANMEYFQWQQRRVMAMQESYKKALIAAKNWDEARLLQGKIMAMEELLAAFVPDEARI
jgi:hypothetical protein